LEVFEELGTPGRRLIASDGGAKSRVWMQIAADALGRPVELLEGHPGSCLGAAYVAAVGVGALAGWDQITRFVRPAATVQPDLSTAAAYDRAYGVFREAYRRLKPLYPDLQPAKD
jgi:xylulokinase